MNYLLHPRLRYFFQVRQCYEFIFVALMLVALGTLAGCVGANPVKEANGTELKAQALYADFTLAEETLLHTLNNVEIPMSVKTTLKTAHDAALPVVEAIESKRALIANLRVDKPEDVPAALLALDELIRTGEPLIKDFRDKANRREE